MLLPCLCKGMFSFSPDCFHENNGDACSELFLHVYLSVPKTKKYIMWFEFEKIIWDTFDDINNINSDIGDRNDNVY